MNVVDMKSGSKLRERTSKDEDLTTILEESTKAREKDTYQKPL